MTLGAILREAGGVGHLLDDRFNSSPSARCNRKSVVVCMATTVPRLRLLEPISKSFKQYQQGFELHKAQEVVRIVLPARHNTALPLEPGKKALDLPPPRVAT